MPEVSAGNVTMCHDNTPLVEHGWSSGRLSEHGREA